MEDEVLLSAVDSVWLVVELVPACEDGVEGTDGVELEDVGITPEASRSGLDSFSQQWTPPWQTASRFDVLYQPVAVEAHASLASSPLPTQYDLDTTPELTSNDFLGRSSCISVITLSHILPAGFPLDLMRCWISYPYQQPAT